MIRTFASAASARNRRAVPKVSTREDGFCRGRIKRTGMRAVHRLDMNLEKEGDGPSRVEKEVAVLAVFSDKTNRLVSGSKQVWLRSGGNT